MEEHPIAEPATAGPASPGPGGPRLGIAVVVSVLLHGLIGLVVAVGAPASEPVDDPPPFVDIEVAPEAPLAEALPTELVPLPPSPDEVVMPPPPEPPQPPQRDDQGVPMDAGIDAAVPEPADAGPAIAEAGRDAGVGDAGLEQVAMADRDGGADEQPEAVTGDGGVDPGDGGVAPGDAGIGPQHAASAGTAANLLAFFPSNHIVTVMLRFDRLRGTEWAKVAQEILSVMPDFETLIADPGTVVADTFDIVAMSSPKPSVAVRTTLAVKSALPQPQLRDFLDEPGAAVSWSRVVGGVLGTRAKGKRTAPGDDRVFLSPYAPWMVLARPKELKGLLTAADGDLDGVVADPKSLPTWLQKLPELEAESGIPDGPALMMTFAPRQTVWPVPDIGLGIAEIPAPERMTLTLEIDPQGWLVKGNLKFRSEAEAESFVTLAEGARQTALDTEAFSFLLKRAKAYNGIKGLSLKRTDQRVSYATSISIADARVLMAAGTKLVADMFEPEADDEP